MYSAHARFVFLLQLLSPVSSRKFVIAVVLGDTTCGGCTALHLFANTLRQLGEDVEERYWVNGCPTRSTCLEQHVPLPFMNDNPHRGIGDDTVVIYPEGMRGNPFGGTKVIRWILAPLTIWSDIGLSDNYVTWDAADIVYHWSTYTDNVPDDNVLLAPFLDPMWTNLNLPRQRKSACYTIRKGPRFHSKLYMDVKRSEIESEFNHSIEEFLEIGEQPQSTLVKVFNSHEYFISFDPMTHLAILAALCGCKVIVIPIEGMTKYDWLKSTQGPFMRYKNAFDLHGVAYGLADLPRAVGTLHLVRQEQLKLLRFGFQTILSFLNVMDEVAAGNFSGTHSVGEFWPETRNTSLYLPDYLKYGIDPNEPLNGNGHSVIHPLCALTTTCFVFTFVFWLLVFRPLKRRLRNDGRYFARPPT